MIKTFLLGLVTFVILLAAYLYFHLGIAKPVRVALEQRGPMYLLFKQHTGAYHKIGPVIHEAEVWAASHGIACPSTFGEYLDNPQAVDEDRLRSRGGCVLSAPLANVPPEFLYQQRGERTYAVGRFEGSPAIAPYKVYPKVEEYLKRAGLKSSAPVIEIYTINGSGMTTEYLFAVDKAP
jgi:hypothetical protein